MGGKRRVISASVFHMEHQSQIQHLGLKVGEFFIRAKHPENIFRCGEGAGRIVNIKALPLNIMIVSLVAVNREHGEIRDQIQALPQYIGQADVIGIAVVVIQGQHTSGQRVHHVFAGSLHYHVADKIFGKRPLVCQQLCEFLQLVFIWKHSEQKQVSGLLKPEPVFLQESRRQLFNVDAAVVQFPVTGSLNPVHILKRHDIGNLCQAGKNAGSVQVAQAALHIIFLVQ